MRQLLIKIAFAFLVISYVFQNLAIGKRAIRAYRVAMDNPTVDNLDIAISRLWYAMIHLPPKTPAYCDAARMYRKVLQMKREATK